MKTLFASAAAQRYLPMRFLLDDEDLRSVPLSADVFKIMRRARRRIYLGYVRDFRRESTQLLRLRLRQISGRGDWESLSPLLRSATRHVWILAGFYAAWAGHGLGYAPAKGLAQRMLRGVDASFREAEV